mmetsp:Transcript_21052/g.55155  ORF Transcript_21052/g.55155 Transcript_21052/m.55155 type:complete len:285 (+) Transcript_21052:3-857(+)
MGGGGERRRRRLGKESPMEQHCSVRERAGAAAGRHFEVVVVVVVAGLHRARLPLEAGEAAVHQRGRLPELRDGARALPGHHLAHGAHRHHDLVGRLWRAGHWRRRWRHGELVRLLVRHLGIEQHLRGPAAVAGARRESRDDLRVAEAHLRAPRWPESHHAAARVLGAAGLRLPRPGALVGGRRRRADVRAREGAEDHGVGAVLVLCGDRLVGADRGARLVAVRRRGLRGLGGGRGGAGRAASLAAPFLQRRALRAVAGHAHEHVLRAVAGPARHRLHAGVQRVE